MPKLGMNTKAARAGGDPVTKRSPKMKRIRVSLLVLALSVCAYAGEMPNMPPTPPPPSSSAEAVDPVTDAALSLLQAVLSLF